MSYQVDSPRLRPSYAAQVCVFTAIALAQLGTSYGYDSIGPVASLLSQQLGFSDLQIGSLNAIYSLPNIVMVLLGGLCIDWFGVRVVTLVSAAICLAGANLTASDGHFVVMACGRLLFGVGAETLYVAVIVALAHWFSGRAFAFLMALNVSLGRLGSYLADRSPTFAHSLYDRGWQSPLWLATGFAALAFVGALAYWMLDHREANRETFSGTARTERIDYRDLLRFRASYWYLVGLCVTFYSVILPFRSTFAIKYFQETRGFTLADASRMNSYVFLAAIFASPVFGVLAGRQARRIPALVFGAALLPLAFLVLGATNIGLWVPTVILGISFSLVPAVLWPTVRYHVEPAQRGSAYGVMMTLQNVGLTLANVAAGYLSDRGTVTAGGSRDYSSMIWFFGLLSVSSLFFLLPLTRQDAQRSLPSTLR